METNSAGLGMAYAGVAATPTDASIVYTNPAGMTLLDGPQASGSAHVIAPRAVFMDAGSTFALTGAPLSPLEETNGGEIVQVPSSYFATPLPFTDNRLWFGFAVTAPFGLETSYANTWSGRYHALGSRLTTINFKPALAFEVTDWFSVGAGINVLYTDTELTNAIDYGAVLRSSFGIGTVGAGNADGFVRLRAEDWALGYDVGVMVRPVDDVRVALTFKSGYEVNAEGSARFDNPSTTIPGVGVGVDTLLAANNVFQTTLAETQVDLPDIAAVAIAYDVSDTVTVQGDVSWTGWSSFQQLDIDFENQNQPNDITQQNWKNTIRVGVGASWRVAPDHTLRAGFAFDDSPVPDRDRTPRAPDADRTWLAVGYSWRIRPSIGIDLGYAHIFMPDPSINLESTTSGNLVGSFDASIDLMSVGAHIKF